MYLIILENDYGIKYDLLLFMPSKEAHFYKLEELLKALCKNRLKISPSPATPKLPSEASRQDVSGEISRKSSSSKPMPERFLTLDSSDDEVCTDSLTSHTTATDSTPTDLTSFLDPSLHSKDISKTESQFSSSMPYLEHRTPTAHTIPSIDSMESSSSTVSSRPDDSVFTSDPSAETLHEASLPESPRPMPRRSTRSTKGKPLRGMETSMPLIQ